MKLLLDVGNTAVKWTLAEATRIGDVGHFVYRDGDFDALAADAWSAISVPDAIEVVNVAGLGMAAKITYFAKQAWQLTPEFARVSQAACGVTNAYTVPQDLGADRWVAMIAAFHTHTGAACIIDCGTAITLDLLASAGRHRGGLILPGVDLLSRALQDNTDGIQLRDNLSSSKLLGQGTRDGVIGGAQYLAAAAIDRIVNDMGEAAGESVTTLITGGDAERLLPLINVPVQQVPGLVLQGLAILSDGRV